MAFDAGAVKSTLGIDLSPFAAGMLQATAIAKLFPEAVTDFLANPLLGLADIAEKATDAIKDAFTDVSQSAHELGLQAQRAGVSAEFLEDIGNAATESGVGVDDLSHSFAFLNRNAADARQGNDAAMQSFTRLGVSLYDAAGHAKHSQQLFLDVADAIARLKGTGLDTQGAMDLLSRQGIDMLPLLYQGSAGINQLAQTIAKANGGMSEDMVSIADKSVLLGHIWDQVWEGVRRAVATPVLEVVAAHADELQHAAIAAGDAMREGIGRAFAFVSDHAPRVSFGFDSISMAIGHAVSFMRDHAAAFIGAITPIVSPLLWSAGASAFAIFGGTVAAVFGTILSPLGLAVAAFAALGAAIGSDRLKAGFAAVIAGIREGVEWIRDVAVPVIGHDLKEVFESIAPEARIFGNELSGNLHNALHGLIGYWDDHKDDIIATLKSIGHEIGQWVPTLNEVISAAKGAVGYIEAASDLMGLTDPNKRYGDPYAKGGLNDLDPKAVQGAGGAAALQSVAGNLTSAMAPLHQVLADVSDRAIRLHGSRAGGFTDDEAIAAAGADNDAAGAARSRMEAVMRSVADMQAGTGKVDPSLMHLAVDSIKTFGDAVSKATADLNKWKEWEGNLGDNKNYSAIAAATDRSRDLLASALEMVKTLNQSSPSPISPSLIASASASYLPPATRPSSDAAARAGATSVTVGPVHATFDTSEASSQIAAKFLPTLRGAYDQLSQRLDAATRKTMTQGGL
jgi:hypothetical protein